MAAGGPSIYRAPAILLLILSPQWAKTFFIVSLKKRSHPKPAKIPAIIHFDSILNIIKMGKL
ncbi:hypothetical protein [[Phormidium] sp. ETS-05]|uniref:hypothetical protein n=1 Tax=[Phormidium] sp. ETS-05 TaxID=222819 RepID=UPI0018EEE7FE|nr:hypothetical protein [[Phormidium] sp. ETS-05]